MSLYEYETSREVDAKDYPFYALLMALMRKADSDNEIKLREAWPEIWAELQARYNAPGGLLEEDRPNKELSGAEPAAGGR